MRHEIGIYPSERPEKIRNVWDAKNEAERGFEMAPVLILGDLTDGYN